MNVILLKNVDNLGQTGDTVKVKDGYGRNYLVPRGLAVIADERNSRRMAHQSGKLKQPLRRVGRCERVG